MKNLRLTELIAKLITMEALYGDRLVMVENNINVFTAVANVGFEDRKSIKEESFVKIKCST